MNSAGDRSDLFEARNRPLSMSVAVRLELKSGRLLPLTDVLLGLSEISKRELKFFNLFSF